MPGLLIVGYGNPLRGDDGVGWRAVQLLREVRPEPAVEILALHQLTPELMETVARADSVLFLDAATGATPGEIRERAVEPQTGGVGFTHQLTPAALLAGAQALFGKAPPATLLTVTGADFSLSDQLSSAALSALPELVRVVLRWVAQNDKLPRDLGISIGG